MDTNQLVEHGRARFEHAQARRVLKEKYHLFNYLSNFLIHYIKIMLFY